MYKHLVELRSSVLSFCIKIVLMQMQLLTWLCQGNIDYS